VSTAPILGAGDDRNEKTLKVRGQLCCHPWGRRDPINGVAVVVTPKAQIAVMAGNIEHQGIETCPTVGLFTVT
jgi:hypothetical protein